MENKQYPLGGSHVVFKLRASRVVGKF
jgi:hypothetical protein